MRGSARIRDLSDGSVHATSVATGRFVVGGDWILAFVREDEQGGIDLNGDGDATDDGVLHVVNWRSGEVRNLGLASEVFDPGLGATDAYFVDGVFLFRVIESRQLSDRNGDGDLLDAVLHLYDPVADVLVNTRSEMNVRSHPGAGAWRVFVTRESNQSRDLNGDGDLADRVVQVIGLRGWLR
jgi:hypothetical protein